MMPRKEPSDPHRPRVVECAFTRPSHLGEGLGEDDRARLAAIGHVRHFPRGATILAEGEEGSIVGTVVEGVLKMQKTQADGRQQIVGLLVAPDMFGRVFSGASDFALEAASDVTLCCYDRRRFETLLLEHPRIGHQVMLRVLDELDAARDWITLLGAPTVAQKFASFLLTLCRRWPALGCGLTTGRREVEVNVPVGRADLAQYLGTTTETISRTVQAMARDGLIELRSPSRLVIRDLPGVIAISGDDDADPDLIYEGVRRAGT